MKKILSAIGTFFSVGFVMALLLVLSPIIIGVLITSGSINLYEKLWVFIRRDPTRKLAIPELHDDSWATADTQDALTTSFTKLSTALSTLSRAKQEKIVQAGFEIFEKSDLKNERAELSLSQTLTSKHASVNLSYDFVASFRDGKVLYVGPEDGEEQCGVSFLRLPLHLSDPSFIRSENSRSRHCRMHGP